jgi:hypothetical protein
MDFVMLLKRKPPLFLAHEELFARNVWANHSFETRR